MKVNIAKSAGFCFGVKRAIDTALNTVASNSNVYMLGDIVHNEDVISQISGAGIKKINKLGDGCGKILLIRAHGMGIKTVQKAKSSGYSVVDATCPMVKEIHTIARKKESEGYKIIIIGEKNHDEVKGIIGQLINPPIVVNDISDIPFPETESIEKAAVVVQSTQNIQNVMDIIKHLEKYVKILDFNNTICAPTRVKQSEAGKIPLENDVILIIGSTQSANTRRLYEISKRLNNKSYWIQKKTDINTVWLENTKSVGILAGASTPDTTINEIVNFLKSL